MWQSIYNWPWGTIWTAVSAIFTASTAVVAYWAILRWRKQDELKAKMAFKQAIADYHYGLLLMPDDLSDEEVRKEYYDLKMSLITKFNQCRNAFLYCEDLLDEELEVLAHWNNIYKTHSVFLKGKEDSSVLHNACNSILKIKFVFK
ncbi:hypothetical protein [Yokenella regensburgei]|uniref:hypothetical protein n=1 Tax=Yokenella regensburgei TaxID=158877 RepID=UPI001432EAE7|nr:hypothetical protein [Yokenella regensburgei]QIU88268.1 hypothetical protein HEC60_02215 [Yokenella regensburgei]